MVCTLCTLGPAAAQEEAEYRPKNPADIDPKLMTFIDSTGKLWLDLWSAGEDWMRV